MCAAQAALSTEALWLLTQTAPKQTSHGVEETLTKFRSLRASIDMLSYYSLQRSWAQRPQLVQQTAPHVVVHFSQGISSVSDTYINAVIDAFFCGMLDLLKPGHQMLVPNHRHNFLKQMKYVQEGLLSDPPGMDMYLVVGFHPITRLARLRTLRNSSDLEGHFLHYSRALHPTAKAASGRNLHVRTSLFDFEWSLKAAAASVSLQAE